MAERFQWTASQAREFWDTIAATPLRDAGSCRHAATRLVAMLGPYLSRDAAILDHDAGTGELARALLDAGYPTAIRAPSPALCQTLTADLNGYPHFLGTIGEDSPNHYDVVLFIDWLASVLPGELEQTLTRLHDRVAPGGVVIVTVANRETLDAETALCPVTHQLFHRWQRLRRFTEESVRNLFNSFGFVCCHLGTIDLAEEAGALDRERLVRAYLEVRAGRTATPLEHPDERALFRRLADDLEAGAGEITADFPHAVPSGNRNGRERTIIYIGVRPPPSLRLHRDRLRKIRLDHPVRYFHPAREALLPAIAAGAVRLIGWGDASFLSYHLLQMPLPFDALVGTDPGDGQRLGIPVVAPDRLALVPGAGVAVMALPPLVHMQMTVARDVAAWGTVPVVPPLWQRVHHAALRRAVLALPDEDDESAAGTDRLQPCSPSHRTWRRWLSERIGAGGLGQAGLLAAWRVLLRRPPIPADPDRSRRACLMIHRISPGGAERQLCYLAVGLRRQGWAVDVVTIYPSDDDARHYLELLETAGVTVTNIPHPKDAGEEIVRWFCDHADPALRRITESLPVALAHLVLASYRHLAANRPDLLVGYLDTDNVRAALAGLFAGVADIVMVGRSVHPGHFPVYFSDLVEYYRTLYRLVLRSPRLRFLNNSRVGAASYADWLGLAPARIGVVNNAVLPDMATEVLPVAVAALHRDWQVAPGAPMIVGVFRLAPEKQPFLFLRVVARLAGRFADLRAVIVGDGVLREEVEHAVRFLGLDGIVHLPGIRADVPTVIAAADLLLHTSVIEGYPNAILEAQVMGRPVVATRAGGAAEAVAPPLQCFLCDPDDEDGLVAACTTLLNDRAAARALGAAAARQIGARLTLEALTAGTLGMSVAVSAATAAARHMARKF